MTTAVGRTLVLVLLLICLPVTAIGGAVAAPSTAGSATDGAPTLESVAFQQDTADDEPEDNETIRHQNPDEYDEDGDQAELERWLSGWLSGQLEGGAIELSEGEYDLARNYVDEEYRDRLGQYVEVSGNDEQAESFDEAQREQERMTDAVAEYNETKAEYDAAREAGDEERARELARELEDLADDIEDSSRQVRDHYDAISEDSEIDLSDAGAQIEAVNQDVQTEQEAVREAEFVETEVTIESATETISFTDPLVGTGELRTADGTPVANEEIRLDVGNQTIRTETDATGSFDLEYRPISVPLSADSVSVEYVPENQSVYLGDETSVPVSIEQVEPTLTVSAVEPETVGYGDTLTVESELVVDDEPVDGVPLAVSIDGTSLGLLESDAETAGGTVRVPADVPAGDRELTVSLPFDDRALASAEAETAVTVTETESDLSVSASRTGDREVRVNGSLEAAGDGVEGQSIRLVADGTALETMTTDENGAFTGSVSIPEETAAGDVQLVAAYDDDGTNLARSEAATTVSFPGASDSLLPTWAWIALGLLAVAGAVGIYRYRSGQEPVPRPADQTAEDEDGSPPVPDSTDPSVYRALLSRATDQLSRGDSDGAVRNSYAAVRGTLESRVGVGDSLTHWEFYRQYRDREAGTDTDSLRDVTEGYERATFDRESVSENEAETVLARARGLCGLEESGRPAASDD